MMDTLSWFENITSNTIRILQEIKQWQKIEFDPNEYENYWSVMGNIFISVTLIYMIIIIVPYAPFILQELGNL